MKHWRTLQSDAAAGTSGETAHLGTELHVPWALQKQQNQPHFGFLEGHLAVPGNNVATSI
jgi:hypothetical protein